MFRQMTARVLILPVLCLAFNAVLAVDELQTRVFQVPHGFMFQHDDQPDAAIPDPFGSPVEPPPPGFARPRLSSREILQSAGITFPEGSASFWDSSTGNLTIRNTLPNLDLTETYVEELHKFGTKTLHFLIRVFEVSREVWETMKPGQQASDALAELKAMPDRQSRLIETLSIDSLSNHPTSVKSLTDGADMQRNDFDASSSKSTAFPRRSIGASLEFTPLILADGQTAEGMLNLALSPSEPVATSGTSLTTAEFAQALVQTHVRIADGETKLLAALPKPATPAAGTPDRFWLFFAEGKLLHPRQEKSRDLTPNPLPGGLQRVERKIPGGLLQMAGIPPRSRQLEKWINSQSAKENQLSQEDLALEPLDLFLKRQGIPHQAGSSFKVSDGQVRIENTLENIERMDAMLARLHEKAPKDSQFLIQVVEAPDQLIHEIAASTVSRFDHSPEWGRIADEIKSGRASLVQASWAVTSGKASILAGTEHAHIDGLQMEANAHPGALMRRRSIGLDWSVATRAQAGESGIETQIRFELDSSSPSLRQAKCRDHAASLAYDVPLTEFHRVSLARTLVMLDGYARFLGAWHPAGKPELRVQGRCHAAFLRHHQITILPPGGVFEAGDRHAEENSQELKTRTFDVPRDFLTKASTSCFGQPESPPHDLFATPSASSCGIFSPRHGLLASGAVFGEGASATFVAGKNQLVVKNTAGNLDLIEAFVEHLWRKEERSVTIKLQLVEAPALSMLSRVEQCLPIADHLPVLNELLRDGSTRLVSSALLQTKSGTAATVKQTAEHKHVSDHNFRPRIETREVGLILEASPAVKADGRTLALHVKLHHDISPPLSRQEHITDVKTSARIAVTLTDFQRAEIETDLTMLQGTTRLIGIWQTPTALNAEKHLQAAFITCELTPVRP